MIKIPNSKRNLGTPVFDHLDFYLTLLMHISIAKSAGF